MATLIRSEKENLIRDAVIILFSLALAIALAYSGVLESAITSTREMRIIGSFVAGMFFTSVVTTAPASVALGEIAQANSVLATAILGGLGAMVGDLLIFRFAKDHIAKDVFYVFNHLPLHQRVAKLFRRRFFHFFTLVLGLIVIASPLPDELGILLLGFSQTNIARFAPMSFVMNFIGVAIIGLVAKSIM